MWHDLSQVLQPGMYLQSRYSGLRGVYRHTELDGGGVNITAVDLPFHSGTHVDSPRHFVPDGPGIEEMSLDAFMGWATTVRLELAPLEGITSRKLRTAVSASPYVPGDILLISTTWDRYFLTDVGEYARHPWLTEDAAEYCVTIEPKAVGLDTPTPDLAEILRGEGFIWPVHRTLLGAGILVYENLANLDPLVGRRVRFMGLPIPALGADGAFVRAIAEL